MSKQPEILIVDDEEHLRTALAQTFELAGLSVRCFKSALDVISIISRGFSGVVVSDIRMPEMDGIELLEKALELDFEIPVILLTGHGDVQMAVEAMRKGAYDFIEKPFSSDHLVEVVRRALDKRRLTLENRELRANLTKRDDLETRLTGRTDVMIELRRQIRSIAPTDTDLLIYGATGCGKEVVARAVHSLSDRADKPFFTINCGAIPDSQIESELFGHEQGAFPGAMRARYGKFEHARGGTIFLDEFESTPLDIQVKLLRVFEERTITRLGSNEPVELDVRFIAASKLDLQLEAKEGRFRPDLYYRIGAVLLYVPTLAERREDIPRLFSQMANEAARRYRRDFSEIPTALLSALSQRDWAGNVRELRNAADRYVLGLDPIENDITLNPGRRRNLAERVADYEKQTIVSALSAHNGVLRDTYEVLGLSRKSLYEKMQKYGLDRKQYKPD